MSKTKASQSKIPTNSTSHGFPVSWQWTSFIKPELPGLCAKD